MKTQIWTAVSTYVLVAIVKKRLKIQASLYEMLQILSLTMSSSKPLWIRCFRKSPPLKTMMPLSS